VGSLLFGGETTMTKKTANRRTKNEAMSIEAIEIEDASVLPIPLPPATREFTGAKLMALGLPYGPAKRGAVLKFDRLVDTDRDDVEPGDPDMPYEYRQIAFEYEGELWAVEYEYSPKDRADGKAPWSREQVVVATKYEEKGDGEFKIAAAA
jgi:hypothetical protein